MIIRALLWANVLIAGSAAGWVVVTLRALDLPSDASLMALGFVLALVFYTRDRLDDRGHRADRASMPERTAWVRRHASTLKAILWLGTLVAGGLLIGHLSAVPPLLAGLGFALTYTLPWIPWQGRRTGWKHLPGMKTPLVAMLWTLVVVVTPTAAFGRAWQGEVWRLAVAVCALIMVQILLNDLRDVEADRLNGTRSLPVVLGEPAARRAAVLLALIGIIVPLSIAPRPFLLTGIYSVVLIWRYRRERDSRWRIWIEGQGLIAGLSALM